MTRDVRSRLSPAARRFYDEGNGLSARQEVPPPEEEHPGDPEPDLDEPSARDEVPEHQRGDAYDGPRVNGQAPAPDAQPRFYFRTSREFLDGDYQLAWLVKGLLVEGQPGIVGGPKKSLKTSLLVELAYSLATGARFLGRFEVGRPGRVAMMSGESGEFTLKETALRVCAARGIDARAADVLWEFTLPQLANQADLDQLQDAIQAAGVKVLVIDPLYLCILSGIGAAGLQASNAFHMGPLYMGVAKTCLAVGCTPLLAHHFKLTRANPYDEPQLEDLAFAGVQEFARQWLLLGRRERFEPGVGLHKLWLSAGGSAGQSGLWAVDVDEGILDEDFRGRKWEVSIQTAGEVRQAKREVDNAAKKVKVTQQDQEDDFALVAALRSIDPADEGVSYNRAQAEARLSDARMARAVGRLARERLLRECRIIVTVGNGAKREVNGLRRLRDEG